MSLPAGMYLTLRVRLPRGEGGFSRECGDAPGGIRADARGVFARVVPAWRVLSVEPTEALRAE